MKVNKNVFNKMVSGGFLAMNTPPRIEALEIFHKIIDYFDSKINQSEFSRNIIKKEDKYNYLYSFDRKTLTQSIDFFYDTIYKYLLSNKENIFEKNNLRIVYTKNIDKYNSTILFFRKISKYSQDFFALRLYLNKYTYEYEIRFIDYDKMENKEFITFDLQWLLKGTAYAVDSFIDYNQLFIQSNRDGIGQCKFEMKHLVKYLNGYYKKVATRPEDKRINDFFIIDDSDASRRHVLVVKKQYSFDNIENRFVKL